jgi:hypothetical protein
MTAWTNCSVNKIAKIREEFLMRRHRSAKGSCHVYRSWSLAIIGVLSLAWAGMAGAMEPLLVVQPSYAGMQFYVSPAQGLPPHWYTTFDGYPVWKGADGIWLYGSFSGSELIPTNYIVGSVVPSIVGLIPYAAAQAAPVQAAPQPVMVPAPAYAAPAWTLNPHFMVLGEWRGNVDRVGILFKPGIPIAWKGSSPRVIYAWTGTTWYQMVTRDGERPGDVLRNNLYLLTRLTNKNCAPAWCDQDVLFLANLTARWGYSWMGSITPTLPPSY